MQRCRLRHMGGLCFHCYSNLWGTHSNRSENLGLQVLLQSQVLRDTLSRVLLIEQVTDCRPAPAFVFLSVFCAFHWFELELRCGPKVSLAPQVTWLDSAADVPSLSSIVRREMCWCPSLKRSYVPSLSIIVRREMCWCPSLKRSLSAEGGCAEKVKIVDSSKSK